MQRLDTALKLAPGNPEILRAKAGFLQVMLRLKEASEIYAVLPAGTPFAKENATLSADLAERVQGSATLADITPLYLAMRQQERFADAISVLRAAGIEAESIGSLVREQTKSRGGSFHRVDVTPEGHCRVNMRFIRSVSSLESLRGLPITHLTVQGCNEIADLEPLRGMPLVDLHVGGTAITDLSPLKGMPLEHLELTGCRKITDLSPLSDLPLSSLSISECVEISDIGAVANCPIENFRCRYSNLQSIEPVANWPAQHLDISFCKVSDISPLRGSPVRELRLSGLRLRDHSALVFCSDLVDLHIVSGFFQNAELREVLAAIPKLEQLNGRAVETIWAMHKGPVIAPCSWMRYGPEWRIALEEPASGWEQPEFDTSSWAKRHTGFGHVGTDGQGNTRPKGNPIWARHSFTIDSLPQQPHWRVSCHLDAEIYLNGSKVLTLPRSDKPHFVDTQFADSANALLKAGENVLAVRMRLERKNAGCDIGIVDKVETQ